MSIAETILHGLESESFRKWYEGPEILDQDSAFANYIRGDEGCKSREEILEDIKRIFGVE